MPSDNYLAMNACGKVCQILSCLLFISIPMTTMFLLYKSNNSSSKTLTLVMAGMLALLAISLTMFALIKIIHKPSQAQVTRANTRFNAGIHYKESAIASLVHNSVVANGQLMVPYRLTDLELQLSSLNNVLWASIILEITKHSHHHWINGMFKIKQD